MSEKENAFLKKLQNTLIIAFVSFLLSLIGTAVPFYFNQTNKTEKLEEKVSDLKESKADKAIYELTVTQIQKELEKINKKLD